MTPRRVPLWQTQEVAAAWAEGDAAGECASELVDGPWLLLCALPSGHLGRCDFGVDLGLVMGL